LLTGGWIGQKKKEPPVEHREKISLATLKFFPQKGITATSMDDVYGRVSICRKSIPDRLIVATTSINSILTIRNPAGNAAALTITPVAGGPRSVSAHLVITQIQ